jgi:hypothetical protein
VVALDRPVREHSTRVRCGVDSEGKLRLEIAEPACQTLEESPARVGTAELAVGCAVFADRSNGRTSALLWTTSRASAATNRPDGSANSQVVTPSERTPLLPLAVRNDAGSCAVCAKTPGSCAVPGAEARSDNAKWSVTRESWAPSGSGHGVP